MGFSAMILRKASAVKIAVNTCNNYMNNRVQVCARSSWSPVQGGTHIVSLLEDEGEGGVHVVVVCRHEGRVDDDAECDEEVDEGVHDEDLDDVREAVPARTALHEQRTTNNSNPNYSNCCSNNDVFVQAHLPPTNDINRPLFNHIHARRSLITVEA